MTLVRHITRLREDAIIGFIFSTFFAVGLLIVSLNPTAVNVQSIIFGNILGIADEDVLQVEIIIGVSLLILCPCGKTCWRCSSTKATRCRSACRR